MANSNSIRYGEGTDTVLNTAAQIDSIGQDFFNEYSDLFALIQNELATAWKGEDADAFQTKANETKPHYDSMRDVISEYAAFLRNTANAHDSRMEDSKNQVQSNCSFGD